ncbi:hypothetical protein PVAND_016880 [Polypedilum vanderplanki]|uniref:Uncharacterized protein n=1 Tax=Polypedilum vanderplanki TaxID=319348 RepID=A0A9J6BH34_POLVA|nr:hypothetical protein PVAND_016880 [Polypedilum vanderplanki]
MSFLIQLPSNINNNTISSSRKDKKKSQKSQQQRCQERIEIQPGCEIVERRCQCWPEAISVCRESSLVKWDFINIEECELNLANLVKSEVEFDEDYTMPPTSYEFIKKLSTRRRKIDTKHHHSHQDTKGQISAR